ncbi:MAG: hypothetical protein IQL11_03485 [Bacteroidales bacterium]|nr:hypothetical protein [Bacteroidales bacterium]
MTRLIIISVLLLLIGCRQEVEESYFNPEKAKMYFKKIEDICNKDNGRLWGKNLHGPIMFVDRSTRKITASQPDDSGILKEKEGIYTGFYPRELIINNIAITFGGTLFALSPLPGEEDEYRIVSRAIHSLFHRYQETIGYTTSAYNTMNMDEKNARLWIKLEWKALRKAINSAGEEQQVAIRDALIFRGSNRELYQKFADDETRFENSEGLATFTYILLCTSTPEDYKRRLFENLERVYSLQSYARSYGFIHGALYATLLYQKGYDFSTIRSENTDLGNLVKELYNIQLPVICRDVAGSLAVNYGIETIYKEEEKRDLDIKGRIQKEVGDFTEKPVVFLELESPYFDFEPEDIRSLDTLGTLYRTIRVSDNWGKLTVDRGGCLISNNMKILRITAKGINEEKNRITGEGWHLILKNGWRLVPVDENYLVSRLMP